MNFKNQDGYITLYEEKDLEGNPAERPRHKFPYSYSPYVQFRCGDNSEIETCVYSDRLFGWGSKKYNRLCNKHFGNEGQTFSNRSPKNIQNFLRDYMDNQDLKLVVIQEGANMSSGYPYWVFHYNSSNKK